MSRAADDPRLRLLFLTPGTGHFYCGSCLRDHALARALLAAGHEVHMVPLYLPHVVDGDDPDPDQAVRLGGINMYLAQKGRWVRRLAGPLRRWLDRPGVLRWASRRGNMTDAPDLGPMTVTMLQGLHGRQRSELEAMGSWLGDLPRPDVVVLSNGMLAGLAEPVRSMTGGAPVVVTCQGEAPFLDALPAPWSERAWETLRACRPHVAGWVGVSRTYARTMAERLGLDAATMGVVANGIDLDDFAAPRPLAQRQPRTVGFLARMCRDKGVDTLVEAFVLLAQRPGLEDVRLTLVGVVLKEDRALVRDLRRRMQRAGLGERVAFHPNVEREDKLALLQTMTVLSVPATYGESFGLYLLEAWASGVPVVQPAHGAFPEIVGEAGGGVLCAADDPCALADELASLLADPERAQRLADAGRAAVAGRYSARAMAEGFLRWLRESLAVSVAATS